MHDPNTQAFVIPFPWFHWRQFGPADKPTRWRSWEPFITIWHHDPEIGGSDDSCGWFTPPFNKKQKDQIRNLARDEARKPWFLSLDAKTNTNPVEVETYVRGAFVYVAYCLDMPITIEEATRWAILMTHNQVDNFRSSLCFKSGYHSNWYKDAVPNTEEEDKFFRKEQAKSFFGAILGYILRNRRPWYRHPRWHIWHWHLQIHPLQQFKRWAFSRCQKCGKGFTWGYASISHSWNGTGPLWFRSEKYVEHADCRRPKDEFCAMAEPTKAE